jgi:hypothetical protein
VDDVSDDSVVTNGCTIGLSISLNIRLKQGDKDKRYEYPSALFSFEFMESSKDGDPRSSTPPDWIDALSSASHSNKTEMFDGSDGSQMTGASVIIAGAPGSYFEILFADKSSCTPSESLVWPVP